LTAQSMIYPVKREAWSTIVLARMSWAVLISGSEEVRGGHKASPGHSEKCYLKIKAATELKEWAANELGRGRDRITGSRPESAAMSGDSPRRIIEKERVRRARVEKRCRPRPGKGVKAVINKKVPKYKRGKHAAVPAGSEKKSRGGARGKERGKGGSRYTLDLRRGETSYQERGEERKSATME